MRTLIAVVASLGLIAGCATQPDVPDATAKAINKAENAIATARTEQVREYAPVDLRQANQSLSRAKSQRDAGNDWTAQHNARLAKRHAQIAVAEAATRAAQAKTQELKKRREQLRLNVREQSLAEQEQQLSQQREALSQKEREIQTLREQLSELKPRQTDRGIVLTLSSVLFAFDSAELEPAAEDPLDSLAKFLKEHPDRQARVEGHTDSTGPEAYNKELSRERAQSVADALTERGISQDRLTVVGYGEQRPIASNDTETGRQRNRRVEFVILE